MSACRSSILTEPVAPRRFSRGQTDLFYGLIAILLRDLFHLGVKIELSANIQRQIVLLDIGQIGNTAEGCICLSRV